MKIKVNNKEIEVTGQRTLLEELSAIGYDIPSLCYKSGVNHQASCMVCMVKNVANGQMIPSCSTFPYEGMNIETDTEEVLSLRKMSLELLLSDHRADCEAPCTIVCPNKIDVAQVLLHYDRGEKDKAYSLLKASQPPKGEKGNDDEMNKKFILPCNDCKAPCEKACRRGTIDKCVSIREIIKEISELKDISPNTSSSTTNSIPASTPPSGGGGLFSSKLGRYTDAEKEWLKEVYSQPSKCLHCACEGRAKCKLREYATDAQIKSPRYGVSSHQIVKEQIHINGKLYFEPAKCIRCGLCVYNTEDGFTFKHRGFDMQVVIPEESKKNIDETIATICPTGALFTL